MNVIFVLLIKKVSPAVLEKNAQRTTDDNDRQRKNVSFTDFNLKIKIQCKHTTTYFDLD